MSKGSKEAELSYSVAERFLAVIFVLASLIPAPASAQEGTGEVTDPPAQNSGTSAGQAEGELASEHHLYMPMVDVTKELDFEQWKIELSERLGALGILIPPDRISFRLDQLPARDRSRLKNAIDRVFDIFADSAKKIVESGALTEGEVLSTTSQQIDEFRISYIQSIPGGRTGRYTENGRKILEIQFGEPLLRLIGLVGNEMEHVSHDPRNMMARHPELGTVISEAWSTAAHLNILKKRFLQEYPASASLLPELIDMVEDIRTKNFVSWSSGEKYVLNEENTAYVLEERSSMNQILSLLTTIRRLFGNTEPSATRVAESLASQIVGRLERYPGSSDMIEEIIKHVFSFSESPSNYNRTRHGALPLVLQEMISEGIVPSPADEAKGMEGYQEIVGLEQSSPWGSYQVVYSDRTVYGTPLWIFGIENDKDNETLTVYDLPAVNAVEILNHPGLQFDPREVFTFHVGDATSGAILFGKNSVKDQMGNVVDLPAGTTLRIETETNGQIFVHYVEYNPQGEIDVNALVAEEFQVNRGEFTWTADQSAQVVAQNPPLIPRFFAREAQINALIGKPKDTSVVLPTRTKVMISYEGLIP